MFVFLKKIYFLRKCRSSTRPMCQSTWREAVLLRYKQRAVEIGRKQCCNEVRIVVLWKYCGIVAQSREGINMAVQVEIAIIWHPLPPFSCFQLQFWNYKHFYTSTPTLRQRTSLVNQLFVFLEVRPQLFVMWMHSENAPGNVWKYLCPLFLLFLHFIFLCKQQISKKPFDLVKSHESRPVWGGTAQ